jgi:RHS repeat-associated protein
VGWIRHRTRRTSRRAVTAVMSAAVAGLVAGMLAAPVPAAMAGTAHAAGAAHVKPAAVKIAVNRSKPDNPAPSPVAAALMAARREHARVEITADRTAFAQTYANPDGTLTSVISAQPRWVRRGSSWVAASADLVRGPDGSWSPKAAEAGLRLSGGGNRVLATVTSGTHSMSVSWPSALPVPAVAGASATYAGVFPGVNLVVTARITGGFTETLVIGDAAAAKDPQLQDLTLGVPVSAGLSLHPGKDGSAVIRDAAGQAVFSSLLPVAWDSATRAGGMASSLAGPGRGAHVAKVPVSYGAGSVRMSVPAGLLSGPPAAYPVYVDPGFTVNEPATAYGEVQSEYPTTNELNDTFNGQVSVGNDSNSVDRGIYSFGLPSVNAASVNVISATMTAEAVTTFTSSQASHTINAYETSAYTSSTTWDDPPTQLAGPSAQTFTTDSTAPDQDVTWDVTSWLQSVLGAGDSSFTTELINSDETNDGTAFVEFSASPTLTISYDQVPAVAPGSGPVSNGTFLSFPISDRVSLQVNVGSGNALLTTSDITLPETDSPLTLGMAYNSLLAGASVTGDTGAYGWITEQGSDVSLYPATDGSVTLIGPDGTAGTFTPASGGGYTSPPVFHATLAQSSGSTCGGTGWTLDWHAGEVMCFNTLGALTSEADRNGNTTAFTYGSNGKETSIAFTPNGATAPTETVNAVRSSSGADLTGYTESGGSAGTKTVTYNLDSSTGNLSSIVQPDNTTVSFGYDSSHDLTSITNGANVTTTLIYNSAHQVTSVSQPYGSSGATATTRLSYVSSTETQVADPNTNQSDPVSSVPNVTYTIDASSALVTKVVDQAGDTQSATYTPFDDVATYTSAANGETTNTYGANSGESLTKSQSPTGATTQLAYDNADTATNPTASFQPSSATDAQNNVTAYIYDGAGNELQATNAMAAAAKVTYNSDGTPATSTDPDSGQTTYSYNANHQLTTVTPPTSGSLKPETVTYDGFGRVATVTNGAGDKVTYTYDLEDRIVQEAYTGGPDTVTVTYAYDGAGNLQTQTDPSGTTSYTYDGRNMVLDKTATSGGGTLAYDYDADGNLTSATDGGGMTSYTYNDLNQMTSLTDPTGLLWEFAYNAAGQRTTTWMNTTPTESTWGGKMVTSYDAAGRITRIQAYNDETPSDVVSDTSYCYSPYVSGTACPTTSASTDTSLLQYSVNNVTGAVTQYSYDAGDRLTAATNDNGTNYSYGYDSDGDLTSGAGAGSLSYNTSNQITTSGYAYDGAGNLTSDPANGTLTYNDAGQLISASSAGGSGNGTGTGSETFSYAGATSGQPLDDGSATSIVYDGQGQADSYNIGGATDYIIRDQQGDPLGMVRGGLSYMFITDNVGSVTGIIEYCGCTSATYTYTPYGQITSANSGAGANIVKDNLIGYTGALTDTFTAGSTGYVHDGARWYDPATGNFTTQDTNSFLGNPANGNRYAYAADNPVNFVDPTGNTCEPLTGDLNICNTYTPPSGLSLNPASWNWSAIGICSSAVLGESGAIATFIGLSYLTAGTYDPFYAASLINGAGNTAEGLAFYGSGAIALGGIGGASLACGG